LWTMNKFNLRLVSIKYLLFLSTIKIIPIIWIEKLKNRIT
jgi:hypothetical protein